MDATIIPYDNLDHLQALELQGAGLPYGVKAELFRASRFVHDHPMVKAAADLLNVPSCKIGIVTGAQVPEKMPLGENDGPLGSVVLAKTLASMGHCITFCTDEAAAAPIKELLEWWSIDAEVLEFSPQTSADDLTAIAGRLDITIAVERLGSNPNGILYGATGVSRSGFRCNMDPLFTAAAALGKPTIGVADGGNEIGCGKIHSIISSTLSEMNFCDQTPCGGGVFSTVSADVLVIATTSNLGCAGITAALALSRRDLSLCHSAAAELELIGKGVQIGLTDGGTGKVINAVDGVAAQDHAALVGLMEAIVRRALAQPVERGF